jgi:hypothetical protein
MNKIFHSLLMSGLLVVILYPLGSTGQNKYTVKVIQPDAIQVPTIDEVTVTLQNKNQINWEIEANDNIRYFNIYRDAASNEDRWTYAGQVIYPGNLTFTDLNSFANIRAYRYKISAVDQCGNEIYSTTDHKSIKLDVDENGDGTFTLSWNLYEGLNVNSYKIYRGETTENMAVIDSTQNTSNTYTNLEENGKETYYQIEASCAPQSITKEKSSNPSRIKARSNIVPVNRILSSSDSVDAKQFKIYPNPLTTIAAIEFPYDPTQNYQLSIIDLTGNTIYQKPINSGNFLIERGNLKEGMYILQVAGKKIFRKKLMIKKV